MQPLPSGPARGGTRRWRPFARTTSGAIVKAHPQTAVEQPGRPVSAPWRTRLWGSDLRRPLRTPSGGRLEAAGGVRPDLLLALSEEEPRACGLTRSKASYVHGLAHAADDLLPTDWTARSDDELRKHLMQFRGVGPWTAEMVLVFVLMRPDVFSPGDIGLVRAVRLVDGVETAADAAAVAERWAPWRTAASWFLWRTIDPEPVLY